MSQTISITNVTKVTPTTYRVDFTSNFVLSDLFYEISSDGVTWQSPIALSGLSSPQTITVSGMINFKIRLSSNYFDPSLRVHTNVHTSEFN